MAFNPFRGFRKHQKVIMASMILVAMLTFVLCGGIYGQGDFSGWFKSTFMGRSRATDVAKLYGKAIEFAEIERLRQQRKLANDYMTNATALVAGRIITKAQQSLPKLDERIRGTVSSVIEFRSQVALQAEIARLTGGSVNQYVRLFRLEIDSLNNRDRLGLK